MIFLQGIKQCICKTEVTFHEFIIVFRAVYPGKIEHKVSFLTPNIQFFRSGIKIIFKYVTNLQFTITTSLTVLDVIKLGTKILPYKTFGTGY